MDEKLFAECQTLRDIYHRWCTFEHGAPGYSELCVERTPGVSDPPTALGMIAEAGRRALTVLLDSPDQARLVWEGCIDNGEDVAYNINYVHSQLCLTCPECKAPRLVDHDETHDGFAGANTVYIAHLECGHTHLDDSADVEAAR